MNQTPNYQLNQWDANDKVLRTDFNADNAKIDAALRAEADARADADSALNTALSKCGNCSIGLFTYTGNGQYGQGNYTVVKFPRMPYAFMLLGDGMMIGQGGASPASTVYTHGNYTHTVNRGVYWSGATLSFHQGSSAQEQFNKEGERYVVVYFYKED